MSTTTTTKISFAPSPLAIAPQRKTMSITQTYFLAHKARAKLSTQAARPDHDLRLLVGHANLLDTLMLELADAEREQESWFNQSVRGASQQQQQQQQQKDSRRVQWAEMVVEEPEEDWQAEDAEVDADSDSDASSDSSFDDSDEDDYEDDSASSPELYDEDVVMADAAPLRRVASNVVVVSEKPQEDKDGYATEEEDEEDDERNQPRLSLTRSASHSAHLSSPPELIVEEDSDASSDDEALMPPSPPMDAALQCFAVNTDKFSATSKTTATITTTAIEPASPQQDDQDAFDDSTAQYYLPPRNPARLY